MAIIRYVQVFTKFFDEVVASSSDTETVCTVGQRFLPHRRTSGGV